MRYAAALLVALTCTGAFASDPGQPLSVEDWTVFDPSYALDRVQLPASCSDAPLNCGANTAEAVAADGAYWTLRNPILASCWNFSHELDLVRCASNLSGCTVIAKVQGRCYPGGSGINCNDDPRIGGLWIDNAHGELFFWYESLQGTPGSYCPQYPTTSEVLRLTGLPTMFEVLQTYTPQPPQFGFRVPYMPEGMGGADHFDTYWGALTHPIDFTQAQPLQCGYPVAPPNVGDFVSVADTVPTPAPGQGVYYITATTYQGQRRDGRQVVNGRVVGRDPTLLPACVQP